MPNKQGPPKLGISLLGAPEIRLNGRPVVELSAKTQALLCYLAMTRQAHPRVLLASLLWGEIPEQSARTNLRKAVQQLRATLPDHLAIERQSIALRAEAAIWVDALAFERQIEQAEGSGDAPTLEEAIQLYRGDFLTGFFVRNAPDFENWQRAQQARLREHMLGALQTLSRHWMAQGDLTRTIAVTRRMIELEPWREEAHRQLMELLARGGDRAAALKQFELCTQILADELNVEPGALTVELAAKIRTGTFDTADDYLPHSVAQQTTDHVVSAPRHNLPAPTTPLIGRERELAELVRLLDNPDIRLVTILGAGGMGKTRLALAAAANQAAQFDGGAYWVSLAPLTEQESTILAIGEALGFAFEDDQPFLQQLCHHLRTRQLLLLLDNFEHLITDSQLLGDILEAAPNVKMLVTSRERLNVQGEWLFEVGGLETPPGKAVPSKERAQYASVTLFLQRVQQTQPKFVADEADMRAIVHICQLMQGVPLAIELAAALIRVLPCTDIAQEIGQGLHTITSTQRYLPERHRSLQAVFDHSWQLLSQTEQRVFAQLSIFRGHFTREAALQITDASLGLLSALIDKSLMRLNPAGEYELHEIARQFAAEKLQENGEFAVIRARHEAYFIARSEDQLHRLRPSVYHPDSIDSFALGHQTRQTATSLPAHRVQRAMRILMISPEYPPHVRGGIGKHVAELVPALGEVKLAGAPLIVDLIAPCYTGENSIESVSPTTTIYRVHIPTVTDDPYGNVLANNALLAEYATTLLQKQTCDLIHLHGLSVSEAGIALKKQWDLPLLITMHQTTRGRHQRKLPSDIHQVEQFERQLCDEAAQIIVASQFMRQEIHDYLGSPVTKIRVVANGVKVSEETSHAVAELASLRLQYAPGGQKLLFFIGHTTYEKGLLHLIRAMPKILVEHPDMLLLVGSKHGDTLRPLVYELKIEEAVRFLGYVSDFQRDCLYQIVDAVVIPSLYEPFGIVALEAMALDCTVIASKVGGLAEVVKQRQTGLLVTPDDPDSIVQAVNDLFADPVAARQWRINALAEVEAHYRWDKIAVQTAKVYESIVAGL